MRRCFPTSSEVDTNIHESFIACSDVVKKPKLDKHSMSCGAGYTCLDCSKYFGGPAEWKSHTSCVSEAEKYQKGLYKGPRGVRRTIPYNAPPGLMVSISAAAGSRCSQFQQRTRWRALRWPQRSCDGYVSILGPLQRPFRCATRLAQAVCSLRRDGC